ncbi:MULTISPECIES: LPD16 domain-containing protein [Paenibacillus]|uniref:LPD16 domain-containing protein n=1 Tax=Paenibacillus TaxID=44249 RepID=UPI0022B91A69|nr:LPD16 domain-containing protein [Paenibacillus caseinilyticus]MCZ8523411.1 hypothetical protein [Paenibacillus caseinilyticus]
MEMVEKAKKKGYHRFVGSEEELLELLRKEVASAEQQELVIMAGHFMLFLDEAQDCLVPGVMEEQKTDLMKQRIANRVGIFPAYTWTKGAELAKEFSEQFSDIKFLLLINDWQYVPEKGTASELRQQFYERFSELPAVYIETLQDQGFGSEHMLSSRKHPLAFPETWLKYRFQKSADKLVKDGKLEKRMVADRPTQSEVTFLDEEGNYKTLISCGITGCAGEVTEMISEVHKAGHRLMVVFAPGECYQPVRTGVEIALNLYGLKDMKIIIADPGGSGEMSTEEIYEKMVNFSVFYS